MEILKWLGLAGDKFLESRRKGNSRSMTLLAIGVGAVVLGMGAAYFLDAKKGRKRRRLVRGKAIDLAHGASEMAQNVAMAGQEKLKSLRKELQAIPVPVLNSNHN